MDVFDGKDGVKRVFDLSGQGKSRCLSSKAAGGSTSSNNRTPTDSGYFVKVNTNCSITLVQHGKRHLRNSRGSSK